MSIVEDILRQCACPRCKRVYCSERKPFKCRMTQEYICAKCLQHAFEKQQVYQMGTFCTEQKGILKMRVGTPYQAFCMVFFEIDYALLSFIYREDIASHIASNSSVDSNDQNIPILVKMLRNNKTAQSPETKDLLMNSLTKETPDKNVGVCNYCNKLCNSLNRPKRIICGKVEHCACEFCIVLHSKYDNGLKFICPIDSNEHSNATITELEYLHSVQVLLARRCLHSDEAYQYMDQIYKEEMLKSMRELVQKNQKFRDISLKCPQCKKMYSKECMPIMLPCFHNICSSCLLIGYNISKNEAFCAMELKPIPLNQNYKTMAEYGKSNENMELMQYAEEWKNVEDLGPLANQNSEQDDGVADEKECPICCVEFDDGEHLRMVVHKQPKQKVHIICRKCLSDMIVKRLEVKHICCPQCNEEIQIAATLDEALLQFV